MATNTSTPRAAVVAVARTEGPLFYRPRLAKAAISKEASKARKKPNYAASGTSNGGTASAAASGRASAQYNYSRSKKQAL